MYKIYCDGYLIGVRELTPIEVKNLESNKDIFVISL